MLNNYQKCFKLSAGLLFLKTAKKKIKYIVQFSFHLFCTFQKHNNSFTYIVVTPGYELLQEAAKDLSVSESSSHLNSQMSCWACFCFQFL